MEGSRWDFVYPGAGGHLVSALCLRTGSFASSAARGVHALPGSMPIHRAASAGERVAGERWVDSAPARESVLRERRRTSCVLVSALLVPACGMLSRCRSFAHGFVSGLVIDIGASGCRVTPVEAGYPLVMAHRQSTVAGDFMDLATSVITRSFVGKASTCPVDPASLLATDASARALLDSARSLREAAADCCQPLLAGDGTFDLAKPPLVPKPVVVGPHRLSGEARARLGDVLFREDAPDTPASTAADESSSEFPALPPGAATIPMMVAASLFACEESARRACGEAVLLTGGVSRTGHCADRLSWELAQPDALAAGLAVHLLPVPLSEVTHSPWMGGSIIASAGTLPDLFISAKEWDSGDASKLLARCI